jgi:hypothetical protein
VTCTLHLLQGFTDPDGTYNIQNSGFHDVTGIFTGNSASWSKGSASLTLAVAEGQQLRPGLSYIFSFDLTNPSVSQDTPSISVSVSGAASVMIAGMPMSTSSSSSLSRPLRVIEPGLHVARIGQNSDGPSMINSITVTLQPNLRLSPGLEFVIQGLTGSGTPDSASLIIAGCVDVFKSPDGTINSGKWTAATGTLRLIITTHVPQFSALTCSFSLVNPSLPQEAPKVFITVLSRASNQAITLISKTLMRNAPGNKSPFFVDKRKFSVAKIGQSSPYPNFRKNEISVTISTNTPLATAGAIDSSITISGLTGSSTPSGNIDLRGGDFLSLVGNTGKWDQGAGQLVLALLPSERLAPNTVYIFSFYLDNPSSSQAGPAVSISASGAQKIPADSMERDTTRCIHEPGDAVPLFVYSAGFLTKDVDMTVTSPGSETALRFTISSSVALTSVAGSTTTLSVTGLDGFSTPSSTSVAVQSSTNAVVPAASWNRETGTLQFGLVADAFILPGQVLVVQVMLTNGGFVTALSPTIEMNGLSGSVAASPMVMKHHAPAPTLSYHAPNGQGASVQVSFTADQGVALGDTVILTVPDLSRSHQGQLWGIASQPDAFSTNANELEQQDDVAAGSPTASAVFRSGWSGKSDSESSVDDGEVGSSIRLDKNDAKLFSSMNIYADMSIKIEGSVDLHTIYHQTSGKSGAAVAYFYPKYRIGEAQAINVPSQAVYEIIPRIELVAKSNICPGVRVNISIPQSTGLVLPSNGVRGATFSLIKTGMSDAFQIGTPFDVMTPGTEYTGETGRIVSLSLDKSAFDYAGYLIAPHTLPSPWFPFIDGYRYISRDNPSSNAYAMLTGYGSVKKSALYSVPSGYNGNIIQAKLEQRRAILAEAASSSIWLAIDSASLASMQPELVEGSIIQLKQELLQFTGYIADSVESLGAPKLTGCRRGQQVCGPLVDCFSVTFASSACTSMPSVHAIFSQGNFSHFSFESRGVCTNTERDMMGDTFNVVASNGVSCQEDAADYCGGGRCKVSWNGNFSTLNLRRSMFSSPPADLSSCSEANPCVDTVSPSAVYLEEGGIEMLQYTKSSNELKGVNGQGQEIRIDFAETVQTVAAGDQVVAIGLPQFVGSQCQNAANVLCHGTSCATITFSGCDLNPTASVIFSNGVVTGIDIDQGRIRGSPSPDWLANIRRPSNSTGSLCSRDSDLLGTIQLNSDVKCVAAPACGDGCKPILDKSTDLMLIKRVVHDPMDFVGGSLDVLRVHSPQSDFGFKVVLVPDTRLERPLNSLAPGEILAFPVAGTVYSWIDDATGEVIARLTPSAGVFNLLVKYAVENDGSAMIYPDSCLETCDNRGMGGFPIGSRQATIAFDVNSSAAADVLLSLPTIYNNNETRNQGQSGRRLLAPVAGFEFRVNGNCDCPSNLDNTFTECSIQQPGNYQAVLVPVWHCSAQNVTDLQPETTPPSIPNISSGVNVTVIVVSIVGASAGFGFCVFWAMRWKRKPTYAPEKARDLPIRRVDDDVGKELKGSKPGLIAEKDHDQHQLCHITDGKRLSESQTLAKIDEGNGAGDIGGIKVQKGGPVEEGPVFVGRPIPITPNMVAFAAASGYAPAAADSPGSGLGFSSRAAMHPYSGELNNGTGTEGNASHTGAATDSLLRHAGGAGGVYAFEPDVTTAEHSAERRPVCSSRLLPKPSDAEEHRGHQRGQNDQQFILVDVHGASQTSTHGDAGRVPYRYGV